MKHAFCTILSVIFIALLAKGQLCQGSLGDPVVKITFGAGANPGAALPPNVINYIYDNHDCPNDGHYAIRNSTFACFGGNWWAVLQDHTGDPQGYFLIVNASIAPDDFYVDTIHNLCSNTTFEFSSWITNLMTPSGCGGNSIQPNITFSIEQTNGTVLGIYNTGNIPAISMQGHWDQYGFYFTTPPGVNDVVIRMKNNAPGGCGNDIGLDDITFRPCGPSIQIAMTGSSDLFKEICLGKSFFLTLNSSVSTGFNSPVYQWQKSTDNGLTWIDIPGQNSSSFSTLIPAGLPLGPYVKYRLTMFESGNGNIASCRIASTPFSVKITPYPIINIITNNPVCENTSLELQGPDSANDVWTGPNAFHQTGSTVFLQNASFANAGWYYITATTPAGCANSDSIHVLVTPKITTHVRNDTTICEGTGVYLDASGAPGLYSWYPPKGLSNDSIANPLASPIINTNYILSLNYNGCTAVDSVHINVLQKPVANAGPDQQIFEGNSVQLIGTASGSQIKYFWTPNQYMDSSLILTPTVSPTQDIIYKLNVVSNVGCGTATDDVFIRVIQNIKVPNAFSPNGDGINDVWVIKKIETYPNATISVFDRNGQSVYEGYGFSKPWDGTMKSKPVPVGTYYYVIDPHSVIAKVSGWVMVLR